MHSMKNYWHGMLGFLSLLGFIGVFTEERAFLTFFAFIVNFEYFFLQSDEMTEAYMNRAAARAFYCGMLTTAAVALACFFVGRQTSQEALLYGFASGWGVSVAVHGFSIGYCKFKESWQLES